MSKYSIKELEKLSGIKAHTIRIWEKRYGIVAPGRTRTNIRFYTDEDLKKVINISMLNNNGIKISKIARLSSADFVRKVNEISETGSRSSVHIDHLIVAMIDLDESVFVNKLRRLVETFGFEDTMTEIIYPFLEKIGVLWQTGSIKPAQEHFISSLIRQKIIAAIDKLPPAPKNRPSVLLFLPENELHELGLLFYHYVVKKAGFRTFYLGQMVPHRDVLSLCESHRPRYLVTAITGPPSPHSVQGYLNRLCKELPSTTVLATGRILGASALKIPQNLHLFSTPAQLRDLIKARKSV